VLGVGRGPGVKALLPLRASGGTALLDLMRVREDLVLDLERLLGIEAQGLLERADLGGTQSGAVDAAGVLLGGRRPADDRGEADDRGTTRLCLSGEDRVVQGVDVLDVAAVLAPVHVLGVPAVRLVAL